MITDRYAGLSCTAFFSQFQRVYSPIVFPQKTDKEGNYVRHFLPQLKNIPAKYIYEPWKCPIPDQRAAGCIIGKDYPKPMFDWSERRSFCLDQMKIAFDAGFHGTDKEVIDGTARKIIEEKAGIDSGLDSDEQEEESEGGEAEEEAIEKEEKVQRTGKVKSNKSSKVVIAKTRGKRGQTSLDGIVTRNKKAKAE